MQEAAFDESCQAAGLNNPENPFWEEPETSSPPKIISSTPKLAQKVPLCKNAQTYIVQKGKTLPASFLTTLLPASGFLEELNESLQPPTSPRQEPLNQLPSSHVVPLQPPISPQMEPLHHIPSSSAPITFLQPLQLPDSLQQDLPQHKDSELNSLGQWAGTDLLTAGCNILASPDLVCPPIVQ